MSEEEKKTEDNIQKASDAEVAVDTPKEDLKPVQETVENQKVDDDNKTVVTEDAVDQLSKEVDDEELKEEEKAYVPRSEFEKLQQEFVEKQKAWDEKVKAMEASLDDRFVAKGQRKSYAPTQPAAPASKEVVEEKMVIPEEQFQELSNEEKFALFEKYSMGRR